ncbi:MAG: hypothetical protein OEQ53_04080 [Saprospiraceae bacterium]|nr:hypothetical protein [Saprospiraceae bacterium]
MIKPRFSHVVPMLPVSDISATIDFYQNQLAFSDLWTWGIPPTECRLKRDEMSFLYHGSRAMEADSWS